MSAQCGTVSAAWVGFFSFFSLPFFFLPVGMKGGSGPAAAELAEGFSLRRSSLVGQYAAGRVCIPILICANRISKQAVGYSRGSNLIVALQSRVLHRERERDQGIGSIYISFSAPNQIGIKAPTLLRI